jgi:hypothetical protein
MLCQMFDRQINSGQGALLGYGLFWNIIDKNKEISYFIISTTPSSKFSTRLKDLKNPLQTVYAKFMSNDDDDATEKRATLEEIPVTINRTTISYYPIKGPENFHNRCLYIIPVKQKIQSNIPALKLNTQIKQESDLYYTFIQQDNKCALGKIYDTEINNFESGERSCSIIENAPSIELTPYVFYSNGNLFGIITQFQKNNKIINNQICNCYICNMVEDIYKHMENYVEYCIRTDYQNLKIY